MHKTSCALLILILLSLLVPSLIVNAKPAENVININSDGTLQPSNAPINRNGDIYTLTSNFSGSIAVHRSNIVIDGAYYSLNGDGAKRSAGVEVKNNITRIPSPDEIWNVTIKNLAIVNFDFSIDVNFGGNDTIYNDYVVNTMSDLQGGVYFWGSSCNNVTRCTISGEPAVYMHFVSSQNTITQNNLVGGIDLRIGGGETVDSNYWSDYSTRYPLASEIGSTGVYNTPYMYNASDYVGSITDDHPLVNPIALVGFPKAVPNDAATTAASLPEFPAWAILFVIFAVVLAATVWVRKSGSSAK
ncbi:MAG: hypothetical protein ABSE15_01030 [Candidatus Bathyarchaeia archaeon]|jgi:hypothetical protein